VRFLAGRFFAAFFTVRFFVAFFAGFGATGAGAGAQGVTGGGDGAAGGAGCHDGGDRGRLAGGVFGPPPSGGLGGQVDDIESLPSRMCAAPERGFKRNEKRG
ncbi:MAG: hypothetical protein WEC34_13290, partial [Acidimicrobiia bacterium]